MTRLLLSTLLLCVSGAGTTASIYKWVDEHGKVHYGDRPPAQQSQELDIQNAPTASEAPDLRQRREKRRRLLEAFEKERADKKAANLKAREEKQERQRNCARAQDEMRQIRDAGYLYDYDDAGNKVIHTDGEREAATRRAEQRVVQWCG